MTKTNYYLSIGLLLALLAVGIAFSAAKLNLRTVRQLSAINKELRDSVRVFKNKYGEVVAQKAAVEADFKLLKDTYAEDFKWIKQHMNIQSRDVKGIFKAVTETSGSGEGTADTVDWELVPLTEEELSEYESVWAKPLYVSDSTRWFSISGYAFPGKFLYKYTTYDHITLVPYKEGKNLFVRGVSENPNTRITGLQGILVASEPKKKPWGIGPSIQIGYDTQVRITPGISVQYSLIRF